MKKSTTQKQKDQVAALQEVLAERNKEIAAKNRRISELERSVKDQHDKLVELVKALEAAKKAHAEEVASFTAGAKEQGT